MVGRMPTLPFAIAFALLGLAATPDSARSEYAHCYRGDPPLDAQVSEDRRRKLFFLDYALEPVYLRRLCGIADQRDAAYIDGLLAHPGCKRTSDIGREFHAVLTAPEEKLEAFSQVPTLRRDFPEFVEEMCTVIRELPMADDSSSEQHQDRSRRAWSDGRRKLEAIRERFRKDHPGVLK